jgi:tRNA-Thr(GGU) m(6)t(6)A37 methyltransferase TsaA
MEFLAKPIGTIRCGFTEKFGVPRQSGMVPEARGILKLNPDPAYFDAVRTLEQFSHVWVVFLFDRNGEGGWRPVITPPRLDVAAKVGVFASRSPHRPNPIGISALKLEAIDLHAPGGIEIGLSGLDLLDGTPVLDLKPYVPYTDCLPEARGAWTESAIPAYPVFIEPAQVTKIHAAESRNSSKHPGDLLSLVTRMLELDPRPTSQRRRMPIEAPENEGRRFATRILDLDIHWEIRSGGIRVLDVLRTDAAD